MKVPKVSAIFLVFLLSVCFLSSPSLCDANAGNKIPNASNPAVNGNSAENAQGPAGSKTNNGPASEKKDSKDIAKIDDKITAKKSAKPVIIGTISTIAALAIASALGYGMYTKNKAKAKAKKEGEEADATDDEGTDTEESSDSAKEVEDLVSEIADELGDDVDDDAQTPEKTK
ncbi:early transcribed membrane protein [Plasmodium chabaudi chabaudi]|uniref:Early transcribed membrane protein n=1 Tax=Plasmodium chabaudi chabaudi TaxID=31271 RepID=A0A077TG20_PLACU|nr:early transcribed membrane protein [Plasmodium chabaudi chabaudi]SCL81930.1 early transcribed membrane protein [Plasmodium chabaudi chabaudi]SCL96294.1 early transcribed membrane protein [Plasmodium chabaudi chabaudi]VTZ66777.1 early transcribed membrane protein [Plasmodium chabaudi chabaudi]|eukprot:XP_744903.1 early transcribed membrane protein [Plasmodium chabaudi chabaudi]